MQLEHPTDLLLYGSCNETARGSPQIKVLVPALPELSRSAATTHHCGYIFEMVLQCVVSSWTVNAFINDWPSAKGICGHVLRGICDLIW